MAFECSDELLATFVPIIVFWISSGIYELLAYLLPNSRLHTKEEEVKNVASRSTVFKAVVLHQSGQIVLVFISLQIVGNDQGIPKPQPSFLVVAWQFVLAMAFFDSWQYFLHRWMHANKFLYKHIHSTHHALVAPYAMGSLYSHPLDGLVTDTIGGVLSVLFSGMTPRTSIYFLSFATVKGVDLHSGLWLPWSPLNILFDNNAAVHESHHQLRGYRYNFTPIFFLAWDKILGTYAPCSVEKRKGGGFEIQLIKNL